MCATNFIIIFAHRKTRQAMVTQKEEKERIKTRREKLAGYFLDMSKLTFATSVLTGSVPLFTDGTKGSIAFVAVGVMATIVFYIIGNKILK